MSALWWVVAALVMGVAEALVPALVFGTLMVAALVGAVVAALGGTFTAQSLVAAVVALVLLALVRPLVVRRFRLQGRFRPTGTAAHVGRPARVLERVTDLGGRVKLAGEEWSARSEGPGSALEVGEAVLVVAIDGATAVVVPAPPLPPAPNPPASPPSPAPQEPLP